MQGEETNLFGELNKRREIVLGALRRRLDWHIRLRWFVPPAIIAGIGAGRALGFVVEVAPLVVVAALILLNNIGFHIWSRRVSESSGWNSDGVKRFSHLQVILDYGALFLLIHFSGGPGSPLIFFLVFHIIFAAMLLPQRTAYVFAAIVCASMCLLSYAEYAHIVEPHQIVFGGEHTDLSERPSAIAVEMLFFTASVFATAYITSSIMPVFRQRIGNLADLSGTIVSLGNKLNGLYLLTQSIGSTSRFQRTLDVVTSELAAIMNIEGVSIKLLAEDGKKLKYASMFGLPPEFTRDLEIDLDKSPLNRRIVEGEPYVVGAITNHDAFQFGDHLRHGNIRSVLFVPLVAENKALGILGAYSSEEHKFGVDELDFFRLAAGVAAVALENARAFETIDKLNRERLWFMMQVTHNLRAPITANLQALDLMANGHFGALTDDQAKYVERMAAKSRSMLASLNELMILAEARREGGRNNFAPVDLKAALDAIRDTFAPQAAGKNLSFAVTADIEAAVVNGDRSLIEQLFENLASNAIKYTPSGGRVDIRLRGGNDGRASVEFSDTGIGVPDEAKSRLFTEFFRADNAKKLHEIGSGLGLAIVKDIVEKHGGTISVKSELGRGTAVEVGFELLSDRKG